MATEPTTPTVPVSVLTAFGADVLTAAGVDSEAAALIATSLATADARAIASHGMVRLLPEYVRRLGQRSTNPCPTLRTVRQTGGGALIDADGAPGQLAGTAAMNLAISLARTHGIAAVGVRNSSHFGIGALYVERATAADMIGVALTNATPNMPPAGGRARLLGTNPLAIGVPTGAGEPLLLDMSTSVVARGKIVMAEQEGRSIPAGWAIDADGIPTVDAAAALAGAVLPMAGYKGAGLALMIDVLSGVLTGAAYGADVVDLYDRGAAHQDVGHFFIAIAVEAFMPIATFHERIGRYIAMVRSQPRQPGVDRIYLPGELEFAAARRAEHEGIAVSSAGWVVLDDLAQQWRVAPLAERLERLAPAHG